MYYMHDSLYDTPIIEHNCENVNINAEIGIYVDSERKDSGC